MLLPSGERLRSATLGRAPNAAAVSKDPASFAMSVEFVNTIAAITRVRIDLASMQSMREIIAAFRSTAQLYSSLVSTGVAADRPGSGGGRRRLSCLQQGHSGGAKWHCTAYYVTVLAAVGYIIKLAPV